MRAIFTSIRFQLARNLTTDNRHHLSVGRMSTTSPLLKNAERESQDVASESTSPRPGTGHPLPLPCPTKEGDNGPASPTKLDVSGEGTTLKLDHLGPIVVNRDGTISRIANWSEMSDIERKNTLRVLAKRNQLRLGNLKHQEEIRRGQSEESEGKKIG
jgi:predicted Fe-S protein YdhL (DUF1289 family)